MLSPCCVWHKNIHFLLVSPFFFSGSLLDNTRMRENGTKEGVGAWQTWLNELCLKNSRHFSKNGNRQQPQVWWNDKFCTILEDKLEILLFFFHCGNTLKLVHSLFTFVLSLCFCYVLFFPFLITLQQSIDPVTSFLVPFTITPLLGWWRRLRTIIGAWLLDKMSKRLKWQTSNLRVASPCPDGTESGKMATESH